MLKGGNKDGEKTRDGSPTYCSDWVMVKDLKAAIDCYSDAYGLGPFEVFEFATAKHWVNGKLTPIRLNIASYQWGPIELELLEWVEGDVPHKWFLEEKGEGVHHLAFQVDNYDEWLNYLKDKGVEVLCNVEIDLGTGTRRAAYVKSDRIGGVVFELQEKPAE
jgi:methylmalonyl-CoA/ethylmalonyl-CoA epimerase